MYKLETVRNLRALDDTYDSSRKSSHTLVFQSAAAFPPFCRTDCTPAYFCVLGGEEMMRCHFYRHYLRADGIWRNATSYRSFPSSNAFPEIRRDAVSAVGQRAQQHHRCLPRQERKDDVCKTLGMAHKHQLDCIVFPLLIYQFKPSRTPGFSSDAKPRSRSDSLAAETRCRPAVIRSRRTRLLADDLSTPQASWEETSSAHFSVTALSKPNGRGSPVFPAEKPQPDGPSHGLNPKDARGINTWQSIPSV